MTAPSRRLGNRRELDETPTLGPPFIKIASPEEQLAAGRVLMHRDGALGRKLSQGVAVESKVGRGVARVEPLGRRLLLSPTKTTYNGSGNAFGDLLDEGIDRRRVSWTRWRSIQRSNRARWTDDRGLGRNEPRDRTFASGNGVR
jgi:hypothetical protein